MIVDGLDDLSTSIPEDIEDVNELGDIQGEHPDHAEDNTENVTDESNNSEITNEGNVEDEPKTDTENTSNLSGVEQYLAQFNIEGGMIDFKDGSKVHFNELDAAKQLDVLTKLHSASAQSVEDKYGLDADEIGLINFIREQEGSVDEIIDRLAQQRAQTYIMSQGIKNVDIEALTPDQIYTSFLLKSNPEATAEQIEKDLATAKQMSNFNNIVNNLKTDMQKAHENALIQQKEASTQELYAEIEDQRKHQGFITSLDRYVDRKEGWSIAKANNQIQFGLKASENENDEESILISENLY